jgi:hypothetical protein
MSDDLAALEHMLYSKPSERRISMTEESSDYSPSDETTTTNDVDHPTQGARLGPEDRRVLIRKLLGTFIWFEEYNHSTVYISYTLIILLLYIREKTFIYAINWETPRLC